MNLDSKHNWLRRAILSALLSALALTFLDRAQAAQWAPGLAFALLVASAKSKRAELLLAVLVSYMLGYASGHLFEALGVWPMRVGMVAIGSALLAASLHWKGGLSLKRAQTLCLLGTALAWPFWYFVSLPAPLSGPPPFALWLAAFSAWQLPMAWYYLAKD